MNELDRLEESRVFLHRQDIHYFGKVRRLPEGYFLCDTTMFDATLGNPRFYQIRLIQISPGDLIVTTDNKAYLV